MVIKVKANIMKIKSSLPEESQNSASPYQRTANKLMILHKISRDGSRLHTDLTYA